METKYIMYTMFVQYKEIRDTKIPFQFDMMKELKEMFTDVQRIGHPD